MAQLSHVLSSDGFAEYYTKGHVRCIGHAYGCVSQALLEAGIDFLPNNAGAFCCTAPSFQSCCSVYFTLVVAFTLPLL